MSGRSSPGSLGDVLTLGRRSFADTDLLVMAIVNRTRDSFYDRGATYADDKALERVRAVVAEGADVVDIGGVKAGPGETVDAAEEIRRTVPFVAAVREEFPDLVVSVDTWRAEVGREVCRAGADLLNDAWGGFDPHLAEVAAEHDAALVCTHTNGATPRTPPHRPSYDDVVAAAVEATVALAERAVSLGVRRESVLIDPAHDFDKNTWHSLELTRRLDEIVALGYPVLAAVSNKDFIGETLDAAQEDRLAGTIAAVVFCVVCGARIVRVHDVRAAVQAVRMTEAILGLRSPAATPRHNM
jgi:dihydropteroate synthase